MEGRLGELLSNEGIKFGSLTASMLPAKGGVYAISEHESGVIYVGRTKNLRSRIYTNHLRAIFQMLLLKDI